MYQNIYYERRTNLVHIWDDKRGHLKIPFKKYAYVKHSSGNFTSLYGDKLQKVYKWDEHDQVFEADVPTETRVLVDEYTDSNDMSIGHKLLNIDIEVEVEDGFPDPSIAAQKITSIDIHDDVADQYTVFVLGRLTDKQKDNVFIKGYDSEEELLQGFYEKYLEINPTLITGWNIDYFDIPYLYNRTTRILGQEFANCLSPIAQVNWSDFKNRYKIAGVSCLDYLALYKLFTYTQQSSYRLDYIGKLEVNMGKIEYDGSLNDLYKAI